MNRKLKKFYADHNMDPETVAKLEELAKGIKEALANIPEGMPSFSEIYEANKHRFTRKDN